MAIACLRPDWALQSVQALATTRVGGISKGDYAGLNLGVHCGDDLTTVQQNRQRLRVQENLPSEPKWLSQVHGIEVLPAHEIVAGESPEADASWTDQPGIVCVAQSADCLPVLFADQYGRAVAAAHAGWRGLAAGILEATVVTLADQAGVQPNQLYAWLGPAIGPAVFQVGDDVRDAVMQVDPKAAEAFVPDGDRWLADVFRLARQRLAAVGVHRVSGGGVCTFSNSQQFYSYRRDGVTGRMATMIWL